MEGAAAGVDVAAIGRNTHGDDIGAESAEEFRAEFVGSPVGAVEDDAEAGEIGSGKSAAAEEIEILGVERCVGDGKGRILGRRIGAMLEDVRFEGFFDRVGELHTCMGEELYAVVVIRIVRGGNNDAGLKIILADEAGYAWSGYDACKGCRGTGFDEARGEESGNVRARLASVHADENVSNGVLAKQVSGERTAGGEKSGVVKRRGARNAANTIGSEKLFGHDRLAANS